jgi:hypothetical protein
MTFSVSSVLILFTLVIILRRCVICNIVHVTKVKHAFSTVRDCKEYVKSVDLSDPRNALRYTRSLYE